MKSFREAITLTLAGPAYGLALLTLWAYCKIRRLDNLGHADYIYTMVLSAIYAVIMWSVILSFGIMIVAELLRKN